MYVPSATGTLSAPAQLTFTYSDGTVEVRKTFSFNETYVLHADVEVKRNGAPVRALLSWPGGFGDQDMAAAYSQRPARHDAQWQGRAHRAEEGLGWRYSERAVRLGGRERQLLCGGLSAGQSRECNGGDSEQLSWTLRRRFAAPASAAARRSKGAVEVPVLGAALGDVSGHTHDAHVTRAQGDQRAQGGARTDPKMTLEPVLEFGFWGLIGKYLFLSLQFIHSHIGVELGLVDRHPHRHHQHPDAALPHQDHAERPEDAAHSAADGRRSRRSTRSTRPPTRSATR